MATTLRNDAKREIINKLRDPRGDGSNEGYATYATLVDLFDIYLTDDPGVIGYMLPGQAKIVLNQNLSINQVSTIVRHEIMHEWLTHRERQIAADERRGKAGDHEIANIAADFEISNKAYTDQDKSIARAIRLGDDVLRGLVTEDQYPGWENMTFEDMYDKLMQEKEEMEDKLKPLIDMLSKLNQKDLDDLVDQAQNSSGNSNSSDDSNEQSSEISDTNEDGDPQSSKSINDSTSSQVDQAAGELERAQDQLDQIDATKDSQDRVFDSSEDQRDRADVAARVEQIEKLLKDRAFQDNASVENAREKHKERAARAARDAARINTSPLAKFRLSLNQFISDQVGNYDYSYRKPHASYAQHGFIVPTETEDEGFIPSINVYFDVSGSFSDAAKTAGARSAISTLNDYVKRGEIEIKTYYFADRVSDTAKSAGGGTRGRPIQDHIAMTKPTNVIIITDGDITDCSSLTTVPGAIWMLFYDSRSQNLIDHMKGKKSTKVYDIRYR